MLLADWLRFRCLALRCVQSLILIGSEIVPFERCDGRVTRSASKLYFKRGFSSEIAALNYVWRLQRLEADPRAPTLIARCVPVMGPTNSIVNDV